MNILMPTLLVFAVLLSHANAQEIKHEMRTWKDSSGAFETEAVLLRQNKTHVFLKTAAGREVEVSLEKLSQSDRKHLESLTKKTRKKSAKSDNDVAHDLNVRDLTAQLSKSDDLELKAWFIQGLVSQGDQKEIEKASKALKLESLGIELMAKKLAREGKIEAAKKLAMELLEADLQCILLGSIGCLEALGGDVTAGLKTIQSIEKISPNAEFMIDAPKMELAVELHQSGQKKQAALVAATLSEGLAEFFPMVVQKEDPKFNTDRLEDLFLTGCIENSLLKTQCKEAWVTTRLQCIRLATDKSKQFQKRYSALPKPRLSARFFTSSASYLKLFALHVSNSETAKELAAELDKKSPAEMFSKEDIADHRNLETYLQIVTGNWDEERISNLALGKIENPNLLLVGVGCGLKRSGQEELLAKLIKKSKPQNKLPLSVGALF